MYLADSKILVTGANGFLGSAVVKELEDRGAFVRAFVRRSSNLDSLAETKSEIVYGDVTDIESLDKALKGIDCVVHAAADTAGTDIGGRDITVGGTRNVLKLCQSGNIKKFVYVSSCSVYGLTQIKKGDVVDEDSPIETNPDRRGAYSRYKIEAELNVLALARDCKTDCQTVCLRPGAIYGPGNQVFSPMLGYAIRSRLFFVSGFGNLVLPLVYVGNVVDAICLCIESDTSLNKIYNVVDAEIVTKRNYIDLLVKKLFPKAVFVYVPYFLLWLAVASQEACLKGLRRKPSLTVYRLTASQRSVIISGSRIRDELNWRPRFTFKTVVDAWTRRSSENLQ